MLSPAPAGGFQSRTRYPSSTSLSAAAASARSRPLTSDAEASAGTLTANSTRNSIVFSLVGVSTVLAKWRRGAGRRGARLCAAAADDRLIVSSPTVATRRRCGPPSRPVCQLLIRPHPTPPVHAFYPIATCQIDPNVLISSPVACDVFLDARSGVK